MRRFAPLLLLAVFSCGGGDPFTPELPTPFDLTLTGPASGNGIIDAEGDRFCRFQLTAIATGGAEGTYALWTEGEIQWYDLGVADWTSRTNLDQEEMVNYWGSDRVTSGSTRQSGNFGWFSNDEEPFRLYMILRFSVESGGEQRSVTHDFTCN